MNDSINGDQFEINPGDIASFETFFMPANELLAELKGCPNMARHDMQAAVSGLLQCALIGSGADAADARGRAQDLLHNGVGSFERAGAIAVRLLESA